MTFGRPSLPMWLSLRLMIALDAFISGAETDMTQPKHNTRLCFYQTRLAWSVDQGSNKNHSPAYNFVPTVTKFCVMWEGLSLPHDTKFGNCRCKIVDSRSFPKWSLIHGLRWSGLIKVGPEQHTIINLSVNDMMSVRDWSSKPHARLYTHIWQTRLTSATVF